jgi:hypothetical protein
VCRELYRVASYSMVVAEELPLGERERGRKKSYR